MKMRPVSVLRCGLLVLLAALVGCAANPPAPSPSAVEPSSTATTGSDAQNRARIHTELASLYFQEGNVAVALEELRTAAASDSSYAPIYNVSGLVNTYLKDNAAADEAFRRALSLAPNDPEISNNYGWFLCQTGKESEAMPFFRAAIRNPLYTTPDRAYLNAGNCALKLGEHAAAEDYFEKAMRLGRNNPVAYLQLAKLRYRRGALSEARQLLTEFNRLVAEPTAESVWLAARIARKEGDRQQEQIQTTQLRRRFSNSPEYQSLLKGDFE